MSIQNIGRNKWRVIIKVGINTDTGKAKYIDRIVSGTKDDATAFELAHGGKPGNTATKIKLGAYLNEVWLPSLDIDPATVANYNLGVRYLKPLHGVTLTKLSAREIEQAIHSLEPGERRRLAKKVLSVALNAALRWDLIFFSPLSKAHINYGQGTTIKREPYSAVELAKVLEAFKGRVGEAVVIVMAYCGLRREEAIALEWQDIDLKSGEITVNKAWARDDRGNALIKPTKTAQSNRVVYVEGKTLDRLRTIGDGKEGSIWRGRDLKPIHPDAASRGFKRAVEAAGLRYVSLGSLRHAHATIALAGGIDVAVVSKNLGHTRISTTVDRYVKPLEAARKDSAAAFGALLQN